MLKVLIVDDEAVVRRGIVLGIDWASLGCAVVGEAANGEEGLAAAERYSPNLIITDVRMPHMDGIEMMRVLRERGSTAHVIVLTAYNDFDYARSALRFGAADYLLKPFRDQELVAAIERVREKAEAFSSRSAQDDLLALPKGDKSKYVLQTLEYIAAHYADADINITTIARSIGISEGHLSHVFKKETSYTALGYLTLYRIHMARRLRLPLQGLRGRRHGRLPRCRLLRLDLQKAHRPLPLGVSGPLPVERASCTKKYGTYWTSSADFHSISQKCPHNRRLVPFRAGAAEGIILYVVFYAATTNEGEQR